MIFMEGNFPFQIEEISRLIGIKVVYLTDDPIRRSANGSARFDDRKKHDPATFATAFSRPDF